jgi:hypothetical protein
MNRRTFKKTPRVRTLALAVLACGTAPSFADTVTVNLAAVPAQWTAPDGTVVPMWDFVADSSEPCPVAGDPVAIWDPVDPPMRAMAGDTLTVNLRNCLAERLSFFVPGLRGSATGGLAGKFTSEAAAIGGTASYTFDLTGRSGTFLYHSATDRIRTQVPMGLYGALVVDSAVGEAYPEDLAKGKAAVSYDQDAVLLFSAIDPALNANPDTFGGARVAGTRDLEQRPISSWKPRYFLINGEAYPDTGSVSLTTGATLLLRLVNAGLDTVVPTLDGGLYATLLAEDGNRHPVAMQQYGVELPAGKTMDAITQVTAAGKYALYDRALHLTNGTATGGGMLTYLDVAAGAGLFELSAATYNVAENGGTLAVTVNRVGGGVGEVSVNYATADGTATAGSDYTELPATVLNFADGDTTKTFNVAILDDSAYEVNETFTVSLSNALGGAKLGTPSSATVTITDNDAAPGTLQLSAANYNVAEDGGSLAVTVNRVGGSAGAVSVNYGTANGTATAGSDYTAASGTVSFGDGDTTPKFFTIDITNDSTYEGNETFTAALSGATGATLGTPSSATVTITENDAAPNVAPTANDDVAEAPRNTGVTFSVVVNDSDGDGTIAANTVDLNPSQANRQTTVTTTRGGTATVDGTGNVTYVPKRNFRGTDTFTYTVNDDDGATSNVATVRVNVL